MTQVSFMRHAAFFGPEDADTTLNIIGVGATGSYIGLTAAKMGFHNFRVWDLDIVESHNLPNQIYEADQVGMKKVDAFEQILQRFNPTIKVEKHPYFFTSEEHKWLLDGPLVLTVDTMHARKDIFNAFKLNWKVKNVFETRLGFMHAELNVLDNMNLSKLQNWNENLLSDEDIPEAPCNERIITSLVGIVSATAVHQICAMLGSRRTGNAWNPKTKTIFSLNPELSVYNA